VIRDADRLVLIDGYLRVEALRRLHRDTAMATTWPVTDIEALVHHRHLSATKWVALEDAWLLGRLRDHGLTMDQLAHRLCRSKSWPAGRPAGRGRAWGLLASSSAVGCWSRTWWAGEFGGGSGGAAGGLRAAGRGCARGAGRRSRARRRAGGRGPARTWWASSVALGSARTWWASSVALGSARTWWASSAVDGDPRGAVVAGGDDACAVRDDVGMRQRRDPGDVHRLGRRAARGLERARALVSRDRRRLFLPARQARAGPRPRSTSMPGSCRVAHAVLDHVQALERRTDRRFHALARGGADVELVGTREDLALGDRDGVAAQRGLRAR
jgi:hypothetical protein